MTPLNIANRDMLYSLSWYMSARKTALRAALSFRLPLSGTGLTDLRVHYSSYFLNLLAAVDLFPDTKTLQPNDFEDRLRSHLVFDGFQDGAANYSYIRELRNAVVHRGLDITTSMHFDGQFPMLLAPPQIQNTPAARNSKTYPAFDKYLLDIIAKCEAVVGPQMLECLKDKGVWDAPIDSAAAAAEYRKNVEQSYAMPENVKAMALAMDFKSEWALAVHSSAMTELLEALTPCDTSMLTSQ
ncbi:hypothetical protein [Massilia suwonensis]|uniref:Apea-like HEPN domain-containing protein n=1 Tax=Massilia suwonensis TaxID=648895 RepID=A0ABW0MQM3_9BURK